MALFLWRIVNDNVMGGVSSSGDGLRVFDVEKENYTKNYFRTKNKNQGTDWPLDRYWIRNFEIIDKNVITVSKWMPS